MWIVKTAQSLRQRRRQMHGPVALVPTMGCLHAGHLSLIERARALAANVVVSIFVNPTQFGPGEDFDRYPRPLEEDLAACRQAMATGAFCPDAAEIYPPQVPAVHITVPALAQTLEGERRPGHFPGVCRIVLKLFNLVQPDWACFGQKDYQQLRLVQALVADLNLALEIVGCPTVREPDGLAMSSRNRLLAAKDRHRAVGLHRALCEAAMLVERAGETDPRRVEAAMHQVLVAHRIDVDYAVVRHPHTLAELSAIDPALTHGVVGLVAGHLGEVRLIDNMLMGVRHGPAT